MEFLDPKLETYIENHTSQESPILQELSRETWSKVLQPRMLSGHLQGRVLSMLSHMIKPKTILEIGTYTGYSAICLSEGLVENGKLHTIEINEELKEMTDRYFEKAGLSNKIVNYIGSAIDIIPKLQEEFDIVFIDADKVNYSNYYDLVFEKVKKGGYIIADNVLWSGKVIDENETDEDTLALIAYSNKVMEDNRVDNALFPIRDGLMISRKK